MKSTPDRVLFTFPFLYFLTRNVHPFLWETPLLLYPSSLYPTPPFVCLLEFLRILVPSTLCWRWLKGLVFVELLFKGYFLINATNKVGARPFNADEGIVPSRKLPPFFLDPPLPPLLILEHYKSIALITLPSSGGWNLQSAFISSNMG